MIPDPIENLKQNPEAQDFWQRVLDDKHFPVIVAALRAMIEQTPPPELPVTSSVIETMAMSHAAGLGARHTLSLLPTCGARALGQVIALEEKSKMANKALDPRRAGTGPGRMAMAAENTPPPAAA